MKKKIFSIGLIVVLVLSSLMLSATPASAGTLAWSSVLVPNPLYSNQVVSNVDVENITIAPNGDIFVIDGQSGDTIYKSVNGGYFWIPTTVATGITIVDIAISPSYVTDGVVFAVGDTASGVRAYISTNSGTSFAVLGGIVGGGAGNAYSIDVAPNYMGGTGEVMVGTSVNVYIWGRNGVLDWSTAGTTATPGYEVAFSPNYPIDGTRLVVSSANVSTLVGSDTDWDQTLLAAPSGFSGAAGCDLAFPSDFNASLPVSRTFYLAVPNTDVYRGTVGSSTVVSSLSMTGTPPQSIAYSGTTLSGTLFAGLYGTTDVYHTTNPAAIPATTVAWTFNYGASSGYGPTYVALANDYAASNIVYAGTGGGFANDNSAFSVSTDGGVYFHQTGLIDTALAGVNDLAVASADEIFLFTTDNTSAADSLWKTANSGATWDRVYTFATNSNLATITLSPDYATDKTLFIGNTGKSGANGLMMSNDGGSTFVGRAVPVTVGSVAAKDRYTILVGSYSGGGAIQLTSNGGWMWQPAATVVAGNGVTDIEVDAGTGHILAGCDNGAVAISTNNNVSYTVLGTANIGTTSALVEFDANYGSNSIVYGSTTTAVARFQIGSSTAWLPITPTGVTGVRDMDIAPDGTLYVTDDATSGNLHRSINPTAGYPTLSLVEWSSTTPLTQLGKIEIIEGSNVVYAIDPSVLTGSIKTYTDTLTQVAPAMLAPADGAIIGDDTSTVLIWESVTGALSYEYRYSTRADFNPTVGVTTKGSVDAPFTSALASLSAGRTYYWQVRVETPLYGPWSQAQTFESQLGAADVNAPQILGAQEGGTAHGGWDASITPTFQWTTIAGATGYEFQLATDAGFTDLIIDATGADSLPANTAYQCVVTLDYNTTYFWRVRGVSSTSSTEWSPTAAFITMEEPGETAAPTSTIIVPTQEPPVINIPTQPAPTITIPPAEEPEEIAPAYIWAVIVIGAILVIALIVLIVRTRRTV